MSNRYTMCLILPKKRSAFNSYTIKKTTNEGGHRDAIIHSPFDAFVRFVGTIYAVFNNIGVYNKLKEDGITVDFFDCVF